jgi:hypothetical protein
MSERLSSLPLLIQSIFMIVTMLFTIKIYINIRKKHQIIKQKTEFFQVQIQYHIQFLNV